MRETIPEKTQVRLSAQCHLVAWMREKEALPSADASSFFFKWAWFLAVGVKKSFFQTPLHELSPQEMTWSARWMKGTRFGVRCLTTLFLSPCYATLCEQNGSNHDRVTFKQGAPQGEHQRIQWNSDNSNSRGPPKKFELWKIWVMSYALPLL